MRNLATLLAVARSGRARSKRIAALPRLEFDTTRAMNAAWHLVGDEVQRAETGRTLRTLVAASGVTGGAVQYRIPGQSRLGRTLSTAWL